MYVVHSMYYGREYSYQTNTHSNQYMYIRIHTQTDIHTFVVANKQTNKPIHTQANTHTSRHTYTHKQKHTQHIHKHIHTYIHHLQYIYTHYTNTHTHTIHIIKYMYTHSHTTNPYIFDIFPGIFNV